jgi:hypothetical protein
MRTTKTVKTLVAVGAVVALLSACGGGGSDGDSSSGAKRSTTTTAARPEADAATTALAKDMAVLPTDYPAGWNVQTEASTRPVDEVHCEFTPGGAYAALPDGAGQNGAIMQVGKNPAFVSSRSWVFPDEAAAAQLVATVNSKAWETCQIKALDQFQKKQKTGQHAVLDTRTADGLGKDNFESYALIRYPDPKKPDQNVGTYSVSVFRFGRVVTMVITEQQYLDPAVQKTFDDQAYDALVKQFARANAAT